MSFLTNLFVVMLLVGLFSTIIPTSDTDCEGSSHNAIFGYRTEEDKLVSEDRIQENWTNFNGKELRYPLRGKDQVEMKITFIEIIDKYNNGQGGCVYISEGGVGLDYVKIYIVPKFFHGFDFEIKIYGNIVKNLTSNQKKND